MLHAAPKRPRPTVLLVEDSLDQLELYEMMLSEHVSVIRATRGATGYDVACHEQPDAIILDVMMPGMDGWEVCRLLKRNPATRAIPVIMWTAYDTADFAERAERAGAAAAVTKEYTVDTLLTVIDQVVTRLRPPD
jgi:CheY-like chemotaxis protein